MPLTPKRTTAQPFDKSWVLPDVEKSN